MDLFRCFDSCEQPEFDWEKETRTLDIPVMKILV